MAGDDSDTGTESAPDQQAPGDTGESKPEGKKDDGKAEGKGKDDKKPDSKKDDKKPDSKKDDEQERKDQFAEAAEDPLADALGGASSRAGESQAYRSWIRTVRASGAAAFVGGGSIGVLNITTGSGSYDRRGQAPGPVRPDILAELVNRYVPPTGYERFVTQLSSTRLLVLRGAPGTGRTTTGLRLLARLADSVARFGPDIDLRTLTATDLEPKSGYLHELSPGSVPPAPAQVDRLRDHLDECDCYLVVIAPHDIRHRDCFDGCIADCPLPDPEEVFRQAVEYEISRLPGQEQVLREVTANVRPGGPQTPAEVHWLVAHLITTAATSRPSVDLDLLNSDLAARYVSAWFEPLAGLPATAEGDEHVRLASFRIALAVLNDSPFDLVAEAAEELAVQILITRSPRRTPGRPVFARHREEYVANSRASMRPGAVKFITATAPASMVAFDDDRLPLAVLRQVWAVHNLRDPLLSWLESLSNDHRPLVYMRAALAIGLLTSWDFSYTFHERIDPWARSKKPRRRWTAAVALDQASRNSEVAPVVREMLEAWCEKGSFAQRWTGTIALGYDLGLHNPDKTLKELRKLGCWDEGKLVQMASWATARIFVLGGVKPVIKALSAWLEDDRSLVRQLGLVAVLRIADMKVGELEEQFDLTDASAGGRWTRLANRRRWPLLVALADEDPALLNPLADLVWQLTRSAQADEASAATLKRWMRAGKKDPACIGPVGRFLALLGDDDSDRARLLHILRSLRRDRDEPLPGAIADRFELAIERNIHITDG
jgi:hypothetical protein